MADTVKEMKDLAQTLNHAAKVYYQGQDEVMSNFEYDRLYDRLVQLEKETGVILAGSPTQKVGYEVLGELPKERHQSQMLSLDKTKEVELTNRMVGWQGGASVMENGWFDSCPDL